MRKKAQEKSILKSEASKKRGTTSCKEFRLSISLGWILFFSASFWNIDIWSVSGAIPTTGKVRRRTYSQQILNKDLPSTNTSNNFGNAHPSETFAPLTVETSPIKISLSVNESFDRSNSFSNLASLEIQSKLSKYLTNFIGEYFWSNGWNGSYFQKISITHPAFIPQEAAIHFVGLAFFNDSNDIIFRPQTILLDALVANALRDSNGLSTLLKDLQNSHDLFLMNLAGLGITETIPVTNDEAPVVDGEINDSREDTQKNVLRGFIKGATGGILASIVAAIAFQLAKRKKAKASPNKKKNTLGSSSEKVENIPNCAVFSEESSIGMTDIVGNIGSLSEEKSKVLMRQTKGIGGKKFSDASSSCTLVSENSYETGSTTGHSIAETQYTIEKEFQASKKIMISLDTMDNFVDQILAEKTT